MRFSPSRLASRLFWARMWWTQLEPPAASLVLVSSRQLLALDRTVVSGSKKGRRDLIIVGDHFHLPEDSSQRCGHVVRRAERCTSVGYRLAVVCELTANGVNSSRHVRFGTLEEAPISWWLSHCLVGLEMGISHLLQEYWCHSTPHLWLWFLGAGNNLLNSDFKGMNNAEGEKEGTIMVW